MTSFTNRAALVIRRTEAFIAWINSLDLDHRKLLEPIVRDEASVYLVEPVKIGIPVEARMLVERKCQQIVTLEFSFCSLMGIEQPPIGTIEDFEKFFNWQYVNVTADLEGCALKRSGFGDSVA